MKRALLLIPLLLPACGGAESLGPFAASSPASTSAPSGQRVPVATMLDAAEPTEAGRSPLLAPPATAMPAGHEHHHHHGGGTNP